jgi:hypothetical protein
VNIQYTGAMSTNISNLSVSDTLYSICKTTKLPPQLLENLKLSLNKNRMNIAYRRNPFNDKPLKLPAELFKNENKKDQDFYIFGFIIYYCYTIAKIAPIEPEMKTWIKSIYKRLVKSVEIPKTPYGVWKTNLITNVTNCLNTLRKSPVKHGKNGKDGKDVKYIEVFYNLSSFDATYLILLFEYLLRQIKKGHPLIHQITPSKKFNDECMKQIHSDSDVYDIVYAVITMARFHDNVWWKTQIQSNPLLPPIVTENPRTIDMPANIMGNYNMRNLYFFGFIVTCCSMCYPLLKKNKSLRDGLMKIFLTFKDTTDTTTFEKQWTHYLQRYILILILKLEYDSSPTPKLKQKIIDIIQETTHTYWYYPYPNTMEFDYLIMVFREKIHTHLSE